MDFTKILEAYEDLIKMDPKMADALAAIRRAGLAQHADTVARGLYTDSMIPRMGNKMAYNDFLTRNRNRGVHVHVDMNDFGQINKLHGESIGDVAIKRFGAVAQEVSRQMGGKSFRNGGDEFKFWFHKPEHAHAFARTLRDRLEKEPKVGTQGNPTHNLAASIGIGYNPDHAETALLHAKKQLGPTDSLTGKRQNKHSLGNAPTVVHSLTHEPTPRGWQESSGVVSGSAKTANLAPPGLKFHNPLAALAKREAVGVPTFHEVPGHIFETQISKHPDQSNLSQDRDYTNKRAFLSHDGMAGYTISHDGEIGSVFSFQRGHGSHAVSSAIANGGKWLSAFDGHLPGFYSKFGFKELRRERNWTPGGPDVVYMHHLAKKEDTIVAPGVEPTHPALKGGRVAMMTAQDPFWPASTPGENHALEQELKERGLKYEKIKGKYAKAEEGFMIHNPDLDVMRDLGKRYGQDSILYSDGGKHKLVYTNGPHEGMYHPGEGHVVHPVEPADFFSTVIHNGQPQHFTYNIDFDQLHPVDPKAGAPKLQHETSAEEYPQKRVVKSESSKVSTIDQLKKGSLQARHPYNPVTDTTDRERYSISNWQNYADRKDRRVIPKLSEEGRFRALHKLHGKTEVRRNPQTGEREFLLHRGYGKGEKMTIENGVVNHKGLLSWTHNLEEAREFGRRRDGGSVSAWIPEKAIHHVLDQVGYVNDAATARVHGNVPKSGISAPSPTPDSIPRAFGKPGYREGEIIVKMPPTGALIKI